MAKVTDMLGRPHSGVMPYVVVGIVTENNDESHPGCVRVTFPTLTNDPASWWVRVLTPHAGNQHGLYALPDTGTEVLVAFLQGSHDVGVVLGQLWNGADAIPAEAKSNIAYSVHTGSRSTDSPTQGSTSLEKNDRRVWRSRSGHVFMFDDTAGSESVHLWDKTGKLALVFDSTKNMVILQSGSGDLHLRAQGDLYLDAGGNVIVEAGQNIESKSGLDTTHKADMDLKVESGKNTDIKAGLNLTLEATAQMGVKGVNTSVEGSVALALKGGATAELKGGAMTKVVGALVMIN